MIPGLENERIELRVTFLQGLCQLRLMNDRGDPILIKPVSPRTNRKEPQRERGDMLLREREDLSYSEIPEWLQEFRENLVDDEIPEHGDSHASSSHKMSLESTFKRREDLGKHSVCTHFSKDRNCEICQRTKITWGPCRRRRGGAVPRAEILVT